MAEADPHREAGCALKRTDVSDWIRALDYAVYHAPGWERWQAFRKSLVGKSTPEKLQQLRCWPLASAHDVIRVLNYTRSLRADWSRFPSLVDYSRYLERRLKEYGGAKRPKAS